MVAPPSNDELSNSDGYFSDDSDFFGPSTITTALKAALRATSPNAFWRIHASLPSVQAHTSLNPQSPPCLNPTNTTSTTSQHRNRIIKPYTSTTPPSHRQPHETPSAFLARLPPLTTSRDTIGPWIWIFNPYTSPEVDHAANISAFTTLGSALLTSYRTSEAHIRSDMQGKPAGSITRKLTPLRKQLELDIRATAAETGCVSGKWMLFPAEEDLNSVWLKVCQGVVAGKLGTGAKVAAAGLERRGGERLICVYTQDFVDETDVRRVLEALVEMGLVGDGGTHGYNGGARPIYYKCDAYTYLGIDSNNEYAIKASIYSSKEVLSSPPTPAPTTDGHRAAKRRK